MKDYCKFFANKKVTVMGLGLLGRGVGDVAFLAECGAELIVTDLKTKEELKDSLKELEAFSNITYVLGGHRYEDFENSDMILKAAGVPLDSPYIAHAKEKGIPIEMSAALFVKFSQIPVIGVTGTRGKSTVTQMVYHTLMRVTTGGSVLLGLNHSSNGMIDRTISQGEIVLGGNVRSVSNLQLLKDVEEDGVAIMELDSWQLQGFGEARISPQVAAFTNFMDDHLDYYHEDKDAYFADKAQIFLHQKAGNVLITTPAVFKRIEEYAKKHGVTLVQDVVVTDTSEIPKEWRLPLLGEHNKENIALARATLLATSLSDDLVREGIETFPGVSGRLEFLGEKKGVKIYNDNSATTPEATVAALKALGGDKNIVLIVGGSDKKLPLDELAREIKNACKHVVLYSGTGTERLKTLFPDTMRSHEHERLEDCVREAYARARAGDILLFSPAFASFGKYYKNAYDRNDQFVSLVEKI